MTPETLLYRKIPDIHVQNGHISSLAFTPMPKDLKKLSVYDGDLLSPAEAFEHFVEEIHCSSIGVLGVSNTECSNLGLPTESDPDTHKFHALIDFSSESNNSVKRKASTLRDKAMLRGWLHKK